MKHFFYDNHKILLETFETQNYIDERPFRLSGTRKNLQKPSQWRKTNGNNIEHWHWIQSYKFLDNEQIIEFEFDYNDKFIELWIKKDYTPK